MFPRLRLFLFFSIFAAGTLFIVRKWEIYQKVPKNYEWNAVNAFMETEGDRDDLLLFEPSWLAGYALDLDRLSQFSVVTKEEIAKKSFPPTSRLWLISMTDAKSLERLLKKEGFSTNGSYKIHSLHLIRFQVPPRDLLFDFTKHLPAAEAMVDYGDGTGEKGRWENDKWIFESDPIGWNQIGVRTESFRRKKRRCLWFHPLDKGVKSLSFQSVPLGARIQFFGGIVDSGIKTPPGAPVYLRVLIDQKEIIRLEFRDTDTFFDRMIDTSSHAGTQSALTFEVQTADHTRRHFCFSAASLKE